MEESQKSKLEDEEMLVEQARTDTEAFNKLYEFYFPKIYGFILKRVGHKQTAEDIMSTTFMNVFTKLDQYSPEKGSFNSWIFKIASNNLIDHYRKSGKRQETDIEEFFHLESEDQKPDEYTENQLDRVRIEKALRKLPEKYAKLIQLKYFGQLTNIEIAEILEITPNSAGVKIHRAVKKFDSIYREYAE